MTDPDAPREILAIGAIFRNEGPYILEWIAHHRLLGICRIIICDNLSDDGSTELLAALDRAGIITHIPFPIPVAAQLPAYTKILHTHGAEAEWFALIDADEFLEPMPGRPALQDWLRALPGDVGGVAVNWMVFGSSGRAEPGRGPVTERFLKAGGPKAGINRYYKTIVRAGTVKGFDNPHHPVPREGFHTVDTEGAPLVIGELSGVSRKLVWGTVRLRHYIIKSRAEYIHKKLARGRATRADRLRDMDFFDKVDLDDGAFPMPEGHAARLAAEIAALKARLGRLPRRIRDLERAIEPLTPEPIGTTGPRPPLHRIWHWFKTRINR